VEQLATQRVTAEDFEIPIGSNVTPKKFGNSLDVVEGHVYSVAIWALYDSPDEGGGNGPVINVHFQGVEIFSDNYDDTHPIPYFGNQPAGSNVKELWSDRIAIVSGDKLQLALSIEGADDGLQSSVPVTLDQFQIALTG
jgi:hypothetical protein